LLIDQCRGAFSRGSVWKKGRELVLGVLSCMGRHTVTGILTASGLQFMDWSSAYRLFSKGRVDICSLFDIVRSGVLQELKTQPMIVAHMDDTILKKTGRHIPGTAWRRDPLGPPFQTNFIWGQRFIQISMALADHMGISPARAIPIDFYHCPTVKKPGKGAGDEDWKNYKEKQRILKLSRQGSDRLKVLRDTMNKQGVKKQLVVSVDGSYTNREVLKTLPEGVTLIGRIRKDTKLYTDARMQPNAGRKRVYGDPLPTPEQIRQSDQYPWQEVKAWAAQKQHTFNVKVIKNTRWRPAGQRHHLQLVVIRPLGYRLSKSSKILYREPAYLICTDNELDIGILLQAYLWRWGIEVNFRDEKTILGCGQAQVRNPESAEHVPAFIAAIYAMLLLAAYRSLKRSDQIMLPRPKWYPQKKEVRHSTGDILNNLRAQVWAKASGMSFSGFMNTQIKTRSQRNEANPITSAMFYMRN
jgi:hypothetical protein